VLAGLTALICFGRVIALVHTPMDVIFGVVFALLGSFWYFLRPRQ
jgi:membrane-associated phospholipid phosphatase